ncbi:MAG: hypothetical protein ACR2K6_00800 [Solirubrobacterales bacterium]
MSSTEAPLSCPHCGLRHAASERFCDSCGMPLVIGAGGEQGAEGPGHALARKINPSYTRGRLIRVAVGRNLSESELISGVLLEQGIPSMLRRTGGFDVPDFLAAGPRDVLVPASGETAARELLAEIDEEWSEASDLDGSEVNFGHGVSFKVAAGLLAALLVFGALAGFLVLAR